MFDYHPDGKREREKGGERPAIHRYRNINVSDTKIGTGQKA
jgi:hypothetical protein